MSALTDRVVDLMDERTDIAVRWGQLPSSDLVARRLGETSQAIVASPAYLDAYGTPHTPQELEAHNQLGHQLPARGARLAAVGRRPIRSRCRSSAICASAMARNVAPAGARRGRPRAAVAVPHAADIDAGRLVKVHGGIQSARDGADPRGLPGQGRHGCRRGCARCWTSWWLVRAWAAGATRSSERCRCQGKPRSPDRRGGRAGCRPTSPW
jgi:hypothetical protein